MRLPRPDVSLGRSFWGALAPASALSDGSLARVVGTVAALVWGGVAALAASERVESLAPPPSRRPAAPPPRVAPPCRTRGVSGAAPTWRDRGTGP